jgi:hypothetical protein
MASIELGTDWTERAASGCVPCVIHVSRANVHILCTSWQQTNILLCISQHIQSDGIAVSRHRCGVILKSKYGHDVAESILFSARDHSGHSG